MGDQEKDCSTGDTENTDAVEYRTVTARDAKAQDLPSWDDVYDDWDPYFCGVWRFENGEAVELLGSDGGEPEDQTLGRDWSWVVGALNDAYALGRAASRTENVDSPKVSE